MPFQITYQLPFVIGARPHKELSFKQFSFYPSLLHFISPYQSWLGNKPTDGFSNMLHSPSSFPFG